MESVPEKSFKYANLDEQTRNVIWQYTSEIRDLMRLTAENIISIGQKLTLVKGNAEALTIFTEQIRTNPKFVKEIIQQALDQQNY